MKPARINLSSYLVWSVHGHKRSSSLLGIQFGERWVTLSKGRPHTIINLGCPSTCGRRLGYCYAAYQEPTLLVASHQIPSYDELQCRWSMMSQSSWSILWLGTRSQYLLFLGALTAPCFSHLEMRKLLSFGTSAQAHASTPMISLAAASLPVHGFRMATVLFWVDGISVYTCGILRYEPCFPGLVAYSKLGSPFVSTLDPSHPTASCSPWPLFSFHDDVHKAWLEIIEVHLNSSISCSMCHPSCLMDAFLSHFPMVSRAGRYSHGRLPACLVSTIWLWLWMGATWYASGVCNWQGCAIWALYSWFRQILYLFPVQCPWAEVPCWLWMKQIVIWL